MNLPNEKEDMLIKQHITDERTGLSYELAGDYYLPMLQIETGAEPIGIWGQRYQAVVTDMQEQLDAYFASQK